MYTHVIFDLDGTLLNTIDDLADAGNHICRAHGWPVHTVDEFKHMVGNGIPKLVERFAPAGTDGETLAGALAEFSAYYGEHKEDKTAPYPGIPELLTALKGQGVRMAVLSNKAHALAGPVVEHYFPGMFDAVQGALPDAPVKPDPTLLRALMERLGARPETTLFVGDSDVDVLTGKNGGLTVAGVLWGFRDRRELEGAGADYVIARPEELIELPRRKLRPLVTLWEKDRMPMVFTGVCWMAALVCLLIAVCFAKPMGSDDPFRWFVGYIALLGLGMLVMATYRTVKIPKTERLLLGFCLGWLLALCFWRPLLFDRGLVRVWDTVKLCVHGAAPGTAQMLMIVVLDVTVPLITLATAILCTVGLSKIRLSKTVGLTNREIGKAAVLLRQGKLVALPTETVYGLAADATQEKAVQANYDAKGRPETKPLNVLVDGMAMVERVCRDIPADAYELAEAFWPGPLTMILWGKGTLPSIVPAGGDTQGVRCPDHPATLAVIRALGRPLACPSANLSGRPSPKSAEDVLAQLGGKIDGVLDGGPCAVGVESTILDLTVTPYRILRQGGLARAELEAVLGPGKLDNT